MGVANGSPWRSSSPSALCPCRSLDRTSGAPQAALDVRPRHRCLACGIYPWRSFMASDRSRRPRCTPLALRRRVVRFDGLSALVRPATRAGRLSLKDGSSRRRARPGDEQPDADGGVARRHRQNRGDGEGCGSAASLGQRKRVVHIPTAQAEAARSGLINKVRGRRDYTLNPIPRGPTNGVQFTRRMSVAPGVDLAIDSRSETRFCL